MKIRVTNKKIGKITEMVVKREYKNCYHCIVTNLEGYKGAYRIYKNWIGMDDDSFKVEIIG